MEKQKEIAMMEKLYKEYQKNVVALAVKGEHTRTVKKRQPGEKHDCVIIATYYNIGPYHCGKRIFKDYAKPYSFEYLVYEHQVNGAFVKVFVDDVRKKNKIYRSYDFTILKDGKVEMKKLSSADFDVLSDEDRDLISTTENCYEIIARSELAEYQEIVDQEEKEDL